MFACATKCDSAHKQGLFNAFTDNRSGCDQQYWLIAIVLVSLTVKMSLVYGIQRDTIECATICY